VINGEGSLHHNRPVIQELLEIAGLRRAAGVPTALVNSSWFANDPALTARLSVFDLVALREARSHGEVSKAGIPCILVPDLALREGMNRAKERPPRPTGPVMVSDSTREEDTRMLRSLAARRAWQYLPVLYPPEVPRPGAKSRKIWRKCRLAQRLGPLARWWVSPRYHAHLAGVAGLDAYCAALAGSAGVVTARFHTVCLCLGLGVPFVAVASNTPKIEALLEDAGLDPGRRMVSRNSLAGLSGVPAYTADERAALDGFIKQTALAHEDLFARLGRLAVHS
jgi:polysaccharide pyruvyl transferase WcaK-like protein